MSPGCAPFITSTSLLLQEIIQVLHNRFKAAWDMHNK
jgi:hypothetical protein